jgi:uncharacterized membrane protein
VKPLFGRILVLLSLLLGECAFSTAVQAEVIRSFHSEIRAGSDTTLDVLETIHMDFENSPRHGIFRIIPVVNERYNGTYTIYLNLLSVTDDKGNAYQYKKSRQGRDISIKIGDPDQTFTGLHIYKIHYTVRRAVNFFGGAPEFYWNATGDQWPYPMQSASARFYPPQGVPIVGVKAQAFFGPPGSTTPASVKREAASVLFHANNVAPGSGLTIVAGLPAGSVTPPSALQNFLWIFADWWPAFTFPLVVASIMALLWNKTGRDIDGNLPAQVEWSPPKDMSPAEVGTLVDESCDMADIVSTLIDLAARGYLRIEEVESEKFLFFQSKDYAFHRTHKQKPDDVLAPHEVTFLNGIFGSQAAEGSTEMLSSLKEKFYIHLPTIRDSIYGSLTKNGLFNANPETTRNTYRVVGAVVFFAGIAAALFLSDFLTIAYGIGLSLAGAIIFLCAKAMPAKTAKGSAKLRECLGFQRFVKLAEKDRIEKLITDDPTIFGRLLPYAMVLGVADQWANKFAGLMTEPPDWYSGTGYNTFSTHYFVNSLGSSMNSMGKTFESRPAPQSTGGSGGSGFSGGGSGGGFGGGGGGSW